jgi:hypothetical protein
MPLSTDRGDYRNRAERQSGQFPISYSLPAPCGTFYIGGKYLGFFLLVAAFLTRKTPKLQFNFKKTGASRND